MSSRALTIRAAIKAELDKIGVTPATGWESGSGAPQVLLGRPTREAINPTPERQIWIRHGGTTPIQEYVGAGSNRHRYVFEVWLVCPDPTGGEDMLSNLERDVRRAVQNAMGPGGALEQNGQFHEGPFEPTDDEELRKAGVAGGIVRLYADATTQKGAP